MLLYIVGLERQKDCNECLDVTVVGTFLLSSTSYILTFDY